MYHLCRGNLRLLAGLIAVAIFAGTLLAGPAPSTPNPTAPSKAEGNYNVKVGGYYQGNGNAAVTGSSLSITGVVIDEAGVSGDFSIPAVTVDATNHFSGSGIVCGKALSITGRLDPVDVAETQLKTARITANFTVSDGHRGRVAGYVPVDPGSPAPTPTVPTPPTSPSLPTPSTPTIPPPPKQTTPPKPTPTPSPPDDDANKGNKTEK